MFEVLNSTKIIELGIDCVWILHILITFTTGFYKEIEFISDWKEISKKYAKEGLFIDLITTLPALATFYTNGYLYSLKVLRLSYLGRT
jgi:hypothetical protein